MTRRSLLSLLAIFGVGSCVRGQRRIISTRDESGREHYAHGKLDKLGTRLCYARQQIAPQMQRVFPGFSVCGRCELPWPLVREHSTHYGEQENGTSFDTRPGCFPLCEDCWTELWKPEYRLPYYMALVDRWVADNKQYPLSENPETKREAIRKAVLAEPITDAHTTYSFGSFED